MHFIKENVILGHHNFMETCTNIFALWIVTPWDGDLLCASRFRHVGRNDECLQVSVLTVLRTVRENRSERVKERASRMQRK